MAIIGADDPQRPHASAPQVDRDVTGGIGRGV